MKVIQYLNGTQDATSPNEAISHNCRTITNIKTKARVSKLNMSKADRELNHHFKQQLGTSSVNAESCASLQMGELFSAIKKMKSTAAACPDNIPPSFLKSLGSLTLQKLLSIFNSSFSLAHCSRIWRVAIAGKFPSEVASFHPISLTSAMLSNFWKEFLLIIFTTSRRRKLVQLIPGQVS